MARYGRAQWARWVKQWKRSGKSAQVFAREVGVREQTLRHWQWQLGHEERRDVAASETRGGIRFVEAVASAASASASAASSIELVLPGGHRVMVSTGFDDALLLRVVTLLGGA